LSSPEWVFFSSPDLFFSPPASWVGGGERVKGPLRGFAALDPLPTPNPTEQATEFPFLLPIWGLAEEGGAPRSRQLLSVPASRRAPYATFASSDSSKPVGTAPSIWRCPEGHPAWGRARSSSRIFHRAPLYFKIAPSGTTPVSRKRHRDTSSLRAKATIPTRRERLLPGP